ncbi:MAG: hypothetical protein SNJ72_09490 [Fimbriimonadales bacterium]
MDKIARGDPNILGTLQVCQSETLEWFGNQILFGIGGEKSDIILLYRNENLERCRALIIELKRNLVDKDTFGQLQRYAYWIAQLVTANIQTQVADPFLITPVAIGHHASRKLTIPSGFSFKIPYSAPLSVQVDPPRIYTYSASASGVHITRVM